MMTAILLFSAAAATAAPAAATPAAPNPKGTSPNFDEPRPIAAVDTVFIEDMTWMEVRDAMRGGKDTVIVATGGIEQNGPYLVARKHNVVLRATTEAIARKLGNALVAPIIGFVPEGNIDPPSGHMKYPSTVSLSEDTYERLLRDVLSCYRSHGFAHIVLLGDSGDNQTGMKIVATELNGKWAAMPAAAPAGARTRIHFIPEYYDYPGLTKWLETQGIKQVPEGIHDDFSFEATMLMVDPTSVRMKQRIAAGKFTINGVKLAPAAKTIAWAKKIADHRAELTIDALKKSLTPPK